MIDLIALEPESNEAYLIWARSRGSQDLWVLPVLPLLRAGLGLERAKSMSRADLVARGFAPRAIGVHQAYRLGEVRGLLDRASGELGDEFDDELGDEFGSEPGDAGAADATGRAVASSAPVALCEL